MMALKRTATEFVGENDDEWMLHELLDSISPENERRLLAATRRRALALGLTPEEVESLYGKDEPLPDEQR